MIEIPGFLWTILFFVLAISPLVFIHEFGHYAMGRLFGVKAEVFSIGFGQAIASWRDKRGTEWKIGWLPMGGYVRFAGDMTAASTPSDEWLSLPAKERNRTFQAKTVWQRALIVAAGPAINFVFAILMLAALFGIYGEPRTSPEVGGFTTTSTAKAAGLRLGDRIVAVDGQAVSQFEEIGLLIQVRANRPTPITVERAGNRIDFTVTPRLETVEDITGAKSPAGRIGISPARIERVRLSPLELPGAATRFTFQSVKMMVTALGQIVVGERSVKELGGPVKIAVTSNAVAQFGLVSFLFFMTMISINLGFINLLPIPTLDGGHLVFYAAEAIRRRPVGLRTQELAYRSGLVVLLAFILFVTVNDLAGLGLFSRLVG